MSVDRILDLGDDQLANQFRLEFPNGIPGGGDRETIELRVQGSVELPNRTLSTYDIEYRGFKIPKTGRKEDNDKNVTVTVRLDQQWNVYDDLNTWFKLCYDPVTGTALPDKLTRCTIVVHALDENQDDIKSIKLRNSKITDLKISSFDHTTGDPMTVEFSIIFGTMEDEND